MHSGIYLLSQKEIHRNSCGLKGLLEIYDDTKEYLSEYQNNRPIVAQSY